MPAHAEQRSVRRLGVGRLPDEPSETSVVSRGILAGISKETGAALSN